MHHTFSPLPVHGELCCLFSLLYLLLWADTCHETPQGGRRGGTQFRWQENKVGTTHIPTSWWNRKQSRQKVELGYKTPGFLPNNPPHPTRLHCLQVPQPGENKNSLLKASPPARDYLQIHEPVGDILYSKHNAVNFVLFYFIFTHRISLWSSGWPRTPNVEQTGLNFPCLSLINAGILQVGVTTFSFMENFCISVSWISLFPITLPKTPYIPRNNTA